MTTAPSPSEASVYGWCIVVYGLRPNYTHGWAAKVSQKVGVGGGQCIVVYSFPTQRTRAGAYACAHTGLNGKTIHTIHLLPRQSGVSGLPMRRRGVCMVWSRNGPQLYTIHAYNAYTPRRGEYMSIHRDRQDLLGHEIQIVWEEDPRHLDYVRERLDTYPHRRRIRKWRGAGRRVGYSVGGIAQIENGQRLHSLTISRASSAIPGHNLAEIRDEGS